MSTSSPMFNEKNQSRTAPPTAFESLLGDSIERAFAQGIHDLDGLLAYLNRSGPSGPNGQPWTADTYAALMARLGA
jgi:hypothetical protein